MKTETLKGRLRDHDCFNCGNRMMADEARRAYRDYWGDEPPINWCSEYTEQPEESTCENWSSVEEGLPDIGTEFTEEMAHTDREYYLNSNHLDIHLRNTDENSAWGSF